MRMYNSDSNGSSGRGFVGRLIIAAIIAIIAWIMYMSQTEVNPVTKEKQHVSYSTDQEIRLGLESAPQMAREMGGELSSSDPRTQEVHRIGAFLVENTVVKTSPWQFHFHLLADRRTVNAFALPGGQIFITLGLYNKLQNQAQLAGVLAHEMGHVIERHSSEQTAKGQLGQMLSVAFGTAVGGDGSNSSYQIAAVVNQAIQMRYSRKDESEADTWGLKLMETVGFDPRSMIKVMQILKAASGGAGGESEIFQSHPNPDLRIEQIQEYLKNNPPPSGLTEGRSLPRGL